MFEAESGCKHIHILLNSLNNTYMIDKNATYQLEIVSVVADILKNCRITRCTFGKMFLKQLLM